MLNKIIIAGNWKMNTDVSEAKDLARHLNDGYKNDDNIEVVVCPPSLNIQAVKAELSDGKIKVGGQNCHFKDSGAYTGEISPKMLVKSGCEYVIIGHSERRMMFNENNSNINSKIRAAVESGLKVILCIGETLEEREAQKTFTVLEDQLAQGLKDLNNQTLISNLIVAYEPIWAIGTGKTATTNQITEAHNKIREFLIEIVGNEGINIPILYGGSMKESNAEEILSCENVSGGLIGGASLKAESFLKIIDIASSKLN